MPGLVLWLPARCPMALGKQVDLVAQSHVVDACRLGVEWHLFSVRVCRT